MNRYVKVPLKRIMDLLSSETTLMELEAAGVDNWPGMEECGELYPEISDVDIENEFVIFEE